MSDENDLISRKAAGLAMANLEIGYHDGVSGDWHPDSGPAIVSRACAAIRALPAVDVAGVRAAIKPLVFTEFTEGGCMGRPHPFQYFITQAHDGRFLCHHDETWHDTLPAAQAHAHATYQREALIDTPDYQMDGARGGVA